MQTHAFAHANLILARTLLPYTNTNTSSQDVPRRFGKGDLQPKTSRLAQDSFLYALTSHYSANRIS